MCSFKKIRNTSRVKSHCKFYSPKIITIMGIQLGVVAHTYNSSTKEAEVAWAT
jgi:hypothetical protein